MEGDRNKKQTHGSKCYNVMYYYVRAPRLLNFKLGNFRWAVFEKTRLDSYYYGSGMMIHDNVTCIAWQ